MAKDTTAWSDEHSPAADSGKVGRKTASNAVRDAEGRSELSADPFASLLEAAVWDAITQPISSERSSQDADDEPPEPTDAQPSRAAGESDEDLERRAASKRRVIGLILEASEPPGVRSRVEAIKALHAIWQEIGFAGPSTRQLSEDYAAARKAFWAAERTERRGRADDKDTTPPPTGKSEESPRGTGAA